MTRLTPKVHSPSLESGRPFGLDEGADPQSGIEIASRLLTTEFAAKYLGLGTSTLERHRCQGTGPQFIRLGNGRSIRYRQPDLDNWCKASRSTSDVG